MHSHNYNITFTALSVKKMASQCLNFIKAVMRQKIIIITFCMSLRASEMYLLLFANACLIPVDNYFSKHIKAF
jgi:hypothetical protein